MGLTRAATVASKSANIFAGALASQAGVVLSQEGGADAVRAAAPPPPLARSPACLPPLVASCRRPPAPPHAHRLQNLALGANA